MHSCCIFIRLLLRMDFILQMVCRLDLISTLLLQLPLPSYKYALSRPSPGYPTNNSSQLSIFHVLSISKRLSRHRLIPTALTSMLSLTHFHTTIFFHFATPIATGLPASKTHRGSIRYISAGANYPLLNYVPNLFETVLLVTILLTVTVNSMAQLLVRGRIDHVLSGLGIFSSLPSP